MVRLMPKERVEFTVVSPTGASGIWYSPSGAEDFIENGSWEQATDFEDNYLYTEEGDPLMIQIIPAPSKDSYVAVRRYIVTDWEPYVPELTT